MACKTFIFTDDFQFDIEMSIPLDKTGFSISGCTPTAIDCGLFKVSTGDMDANGDFLDAGPSLSYSYSTHDRPQLSLEAGITFLDVTIAKTDIKYIPQDSNFVFTVTYPKRLLGVESPAISFTWSREGGFQITNWPLINPSLIGLNEELTSAIIQYLAQPSSEGCSAIVGQVIEKNTITSKFNISMSTANKSKWNSNDLFALQLGGTYSISIVGDIAISSVDLPDIVVHLPTVENDNLTMGKVANYILNTVKDNAGSMAQQLIQQSDRLAKLIGAMALKKMAQEALVKVVNSFMCRGVEESEIKVPLEEEAAQSKSELEEGEAEMASATSEFDSLRVPSASDAGFAAWAESAANVIEAAASIGGIIGGLLSLLNSLAEFFGGGSNSNKYKKKRHDADEKAKNADEKAKNARNEIENKLILESPLIGDVLDNVLDISWTPVPSTVPDAEYAVIQSPVDPPSHFSHVTSNTSWRVENDSFYTASKVTVSIGVSCTVTNKNHQKVTFTGTPPLLTRVFSNTATLPPTKNVTLTVEPSSRALAGNVRGISQDSQAVLIELVGIALDGNRSQVVSSQTVKTQPGSVGDIHYTFPPNEYMKFSGKEFIVQSQSLREGLQSI